MPGHRVPTALRGLRVGILGLSRCVRCRQRWQPLPKGGGVPAPRPPERQCRQPRVREGPALPVALVLVSPHIISAIHSGVTVVPGGGLGQLRQGAP